LARRPTPNPRRGILRAVITVIVLTALLIVAILVVSSLTAPSAKAPTTPPSPGPITPLTTPTSATPGTKHATATPGAVPSPTHKKKTLGSLLQHSTHVTALERSPGISLLRRAAQQTAAGIVVRSQRRLVWFTAAANGVAAARLWIRTLPAGMALNVGSADPLVKPVWSSNGRLLLYVRSMQSRAHPGVRWTLLQYDSQTRTSTKLASLFGYGMTPLGWWHHQPLFLAVTATDTSVYAASAGRPHFLTVLAPQVITSAALSPHTPIVAFAAPTNCYNCTLEFFDLRTSTEWNGPSWIAGEDQFAWTQDGRNVATVVHNRVAVVSSSAPVHLRVGRSIASPSLWLHSLRISILPSGVRLLDTVSGRTFVSPLRSGTL
jgi:hypothetical protein